MIIKIQLIIYTKSQSINTGDEKNIIVIRVAAPVIHYDHD